ncbi:MAG: hypothetical protein JWP98_1678, partial [Edaphobacter sp.]|nr:hypothetical protein [Edaphobacter sp.]
GKQRQRQATAKASNGKGKQRKGWLGEVYVPTLRKGAKDGAPGRLRL